jgi:hypothetical protein
LPDARRALRAYAARQQAARAQPAATARPQGFHNVFAGWLEHDPSRQAKGGGMGLKLGGNAPDFDAESTQGGSGSRSSSGELRRSVLL